MGGRFRRAERMSAHRAPASTELLTAGSPRIRRATPGDVDQVMAIERSSFSDPWSRQSFASLLADPRVFFQVLDGDEAAVAGYVVAWFVLDEGEIANLAVDAGQRGRQFGSALLDAVIREAARRRVRSVFLEVRDSNDRARNLYAGRGFLEIGRRRGYYRRPTEDALVLRLTLDPAGEDVHQQVQSK